MQWKAAQQHSFGAWLNSKLDKAGSSRQVEDLTKDLCDGVVLLVCLGQLYPELTLPKYHSEPKSEVHRLDNLAVALKLLETQGVRLESVTARMLLEGSEVAVMGLVWTLIKEVELQRLAGAMGGAHAKAKDPLLEWVRSKCGPKGVRVDNWTSSWADGRALLAIVSSLRPDLVDFAAVGPETNGRRNVERALDVGEDEMSIAAIVSVSDVLVPEERSIVTHVAQYLAYELLHGKVLASLSKLAQQQAPAPAPAVDGAVAQLAALRLEQQRKASELQTAQGLLMAQRAQLEQQRAALALQQQQAQLVQMQQQQQLAAQRAQYEAMQRDQQELEMRKQQHEFAMQQQAALLQQQHYQQQEAFRQYQLQQQAMQQQQQRPLFSPLLPPPVPPPQYLGHAGDRGGSGTINVTIKDSSQLAGGSSAALLMPQTAPQAALQEIVCKKCKQITKYTTAQAAVRVRCKGCSAVLIKKGLMRQ